MRTGYEARLGRDVPEMTHWYPQFSLVVPLSGDPYWHGLLRPFDTRLATYRVALEYPHDAGDVPKIWCLSPEISKRTRFTDPHINIDGSLCTFFGPDRTYDPTAHDISRLVDLTVDWLRRYVFFQEYGYWPGKEAPHYAAEVIAELGRNVNANCVCGRAKPFRSCCRAAYIQAVEVEKRHAANAEDTFRTQRLTAAILAEMRARLGPAYFAQLTPRAGPPVDLIAKYCREANGAARSLVEMNNF